MIAIILWSYYSDVQIERERKKAETVYQEENDKDTGH